jgi:hypothetical protein
MKAGALIICEGFVKLNEHLAIKRTGRKDKFCNHCGEKMPSD